MTSERAEAMRAIAAEVRACTLCDLHRSRTHAVPGAGNISSPIMFIGEGPGFNEDQQGLPFVGRSGDYLTELLRGIGLERKLVFITNVVKCRPPDNRDPLPSEIETCRPYLDRQIALIDPLVIVTLGRFSMARYFPGEKISQIHGQPKYEDGRAYYPLFHPAAVLRNPSLRPAMEADFQRILDVLDEARRRRAAGILRVKPAPGEGQTDASSDENETPTQLSLF